MFNLESHKKTIQKNSFATPENYFELNKEKVLSEVRKTKIISQKNNNYAVYYLIGSAAALLILIFSIFNNSSEVINTQNQNISSTDIPFDYFDDIPLEEFENELLPKDTSNALTINYLIEEEISLELIAENYTL